MDILNRTKTISWAVCGVLIVVGGCNRDVRLAGRNVQHIEVQTVNHYNMNLTEQASPEQVAYVALRAILDDFTATSKEQREAALQKQFDVAAANVIQSRNRTKLSRDEYLYNVVNHWTPTVSHYVQSFDADWEAMKSRLVRRKINTGSSSDKDVSECGVTLVADDPGGDPLARVVVVVWMAMDSGYWRVVHLGFDPNHRTIEKTAHRSEG